jgi:hypothetical protein
MPWTTALSPGTEGSNPSSSSGESEENFASRVTRRNVTLGNPTLTSELKERLRSGLLSAPARMLQAAAPFLFGLLLRPGRARSDYQLGCASPLSPRCSLLRPRAAVAAHPSPRFS